MIGILALFILSSLAPFSKCLETNISYYRSGDWPWVLAHRGASGYVPESTLESFSIAFYGNTTFVEMDVVLTKDKELLVMHDPSLSRVTNVEQFPEFAERKKSRVVDGKNITDWFTDDFTMEEIKKLGIKQGLVKTRPSIFDYKFKAPSLDEFLQFMLHQNNARKARYPESPPIGVFLEAKNGNMYKEIWGPDFEIGELLLNKLTTYGLSDAENATFYCPIVLQSFPIETTKYFHESGNNLPRIQLLNQGLYNFSLEECSKVAHGVGVSFPMIFTRGENGEIQKTDYVKRAHNLGMKVFPYTFQDDVYVFGEDSQEMYLIAKEYLEIDGVFTEFFDVAINAYQTAQGLGRKQRKRQEVEEL